MKTWDTTPRTMEDIMDDPTTPDDVKQAIKDGSYIRIIIPSDRDVSQLATVNAQRLVEAFVKRDSMIITDGTILGKPCTFLSKIEEDQGDGKFVYSPLCILFSENLVDDILNDNGHPAVMRKTRLN